MSHVCMCCSITEPFCSRAGINLGCIRARARNHPQILVARQHRARADTHKHPSILRQQGNTNTKKVPRHFMPSGCRVFLVNFSPSETSQLLPSLRTSCYSVHCAQSAPHRRVDLMTWFACNWR